VWKATVARYASGQQTHCPVVEALCRDGSLSVGAIRPVNDRRAHWRSGNTPRRIHKAIAPSSIVAGSVNTHDRKMRKGDTPSHSGQSPHGPDAKDRGGNGVSDTDRDAEFRRSLDHGCARDLGSKALNGVKCCHPQTQRADDSPSAVRSADCRDRGATEDNPDRHGHILPAVVQCQGHSEDAHRLLCVVAPVAERHVRGGRSLEMFKDGHDPPS
jgi:hypothetical protein